MHAAEELLKLDIYALSEKIRLKEISPLEVVQESLNRIDSVNPLLNAFITIANQGALNAAKAAERDILSGNWKGPLHGVPIGLKDLFDTANMPTTKGSNIYRDYVPAMDATTVKRLKNAGAIVIGKLNTHQFAYGPTGDISDFGAAHNPYHTAKITGGSSSGSGAAVASGLCFGAMGSDTGGSIRIPASCCGIVGMKPTFGRVSKFGVFPLAYSLDHAGPMTRTVRDNALMLNVLAGYDELDPYSVLREEEDFTRSFDRSLKGSKIGIPRHFFFDRLNEEVRAAVDHAIRIFENLGAEILEVDIEGIDEISWAQLITIRSEAYAIHEEHLKLKSDELHPDVKERLLTGADTKAYEYVNATQIRHKVKAAFLSVLESVDVLLTPTLPILPPDIGQNEIYLEGRYEPVRPELLRLTGPTNSTGLPSLSVPCGFSEAGLPIGMQLIGKPFAEAEVYRFGYAFEQEMSLPTLKWDVGV